MSFIRRLACFFYGIALSAFALTGDPTKVFILVGQSNMQGHAHERTLGSMKGDPNTAWMLTQIRDRDGNRLEQNQVWVSSLSSEGLKEGALGLGFGASEEKLGPELAFGLSLHQSLGEPIVLIKAAWGGKSLHTDFRPPSAGVYQLSQAQLDQMRQQGKDVEQEQALRAGQCGHYYREMMEHVQSTMKRLADNPPTQHHGRSYRISGLVWFQGWNDMVDGAVYPERGKKGGYDAYTNLLGQWIQDVRRDLGFPDLPIVIGVMGVGGPVSHYRQDQLRYAGIHQSFRDAMAAVAQQPAMQGSVAAVLTEQCWDIELSQLRYRETQWRQQVREMAKKPTNQGTKPEIIEEALRQKMFTEAEWHQLKSGISNAEYHYLGSATIMSRIGMAFAKAMEGMLSK